MYGFWWKSDGACMDLMKSLEVPALFCLVFWCVLHGSTCISGRVFWYVSDRLSNVSVVTLRVICFTASEVSVNPMEVTLPEPLAQWELWIKSCYLTYMIYVLLFLIYHILYIYVIFGTLYIYVNIHTYIHIYIYQIILDNIVYIYMLN